MSTPLALDDQRVFIAGRLAGMSKRDAYALVRRHGGVPVTRFDDSVNLIVLGENERDDQGPLHERLDEPFRTAVAEGRTDVVSESDLWQQLGLVQSAEDVHRLYTPGTLASLISVPAALVHRWVRRGWLRPTQEVRRLPYFDFQEVTTARRLAELTAAGARPGEINRLVATLRRERPDVERPLAELPVRIEGKHLLLRRAGRLVEPGGQLRIDFDAEGESSEEPDDEPATVEELLDWAAELEAEERLGDAADMYRAALAAGGPRADVAFALAEVLYRQQDLPAARERYYMAIEIDEDYVEARSNLGCVLAELGDRELAVAAFQGALACHPDYPDAHYHLARTFDDLDRRDEADPHWKEFLDLAPDSPWADEAWQRLGDEWA